MTVAFCGHREICRNEIIVEKLYDVVERLIHNGANEFLLGGYGDFDMLAAVTVNELKSKYPDIKSVLVIPYLNREFDMNLYDDTVYPPLENVPLIYAMPKRNEWMVRNCDILIAYVIQSWGGAATTIEYAKRKKKKIINIAI